EQALHIEHELPLRPARGDIEALLGTLSQQKGDLETAAWRLQRALTIHRELGYLRGEAIALSNLAANEYARGLLDQAVDTFGRALERHLASANPRGAGLALQNRASLLQELGRLSEAQADLERGCALLEQSGDVRALGYLQSTLADLRGIQGDFEGAQEALDRGKALFDQLGDVVNGAIHQLVWARVLIEARQPEDARERLARADRLVEGLELGQQSAFGSLRAEVTAALGLKNPSGS
ncbi:MAG: tetratricopeptide repeat protein, partial [Myxococcales bacterium]|nr:tetratricopeptide repeat protein [Myxococcales bacterium]